MDKSKKMQTYYFPTIPQCVEFTFNAFGCKIPKVVLQAYCGQVIVRCQITDQYGKIRKYHPHHMGVERTASSKMKQQLILHKEVQDTT